jgi:phosphatidylinositol alpha-mannosyltransferase
MKIGLVFPYNVARGGGVKEIVRAITDGANERGHTAKIITPLPRDIGDTDTNDIIFLGNGADFKSPTHTTAQVSASVSLDEIDRTLAEHNFDVLNFHEPWVPVLSRQVLSRSKAVNVATFHAHVPETLMSRTIVKVVTPYTKSVLRYLHELTAVSEAAAQYVTSLTDHPVTIIPNGIELAHFKTNQSDKHPHNEKTILYIGRLERRKGVKYLLQAFQLLQQSMEDIHLVIAGDGPDRQKLEDLVELMGLKHVTFLGYVTDQQKFNLLQTADLFVSPALYGESFGIVLLESMAAGLVTVAGDNPGYSAVMQGLGGISLVDPRSSAEFARRLDLLLNEPTLRKVWQEWAKQYVKQFNYEKIVDQYIEVFEHAISTHASKVSK